MIKTNILQRNTHTRLSEVTTPTTSNKSGGEKQ